MFNQYKDVPDTPKKTRNEPRKDLKEIPMDEKTTLFFIQRRTARINAAQERALEAPIIKAGKPPTTGSHDY